MILSSRVTDLTLNWISHNGYLKELKELGSVNELKKWVIKKMRFTDIEERERFIKGARLVRWEDVYRSTQSEKNKIRLFVTTIAKIMTKKERRS